MGLNIGVFIAAMTATLFAASSSAAETITASPWVLIMTGLLTSGFLTAGINVWFSRRKTGSEANKSNAEAADIIQEAAGELILQLRESARISEENHQRQTQELLTKIENLQRKVDELPALQRSVEDLSRGVELLTSQLRDNGIHPVFTPSGSLF